MAYTLTPAPGTISISGSTITGTGTTFTAYKMGALIFVEDVGVVGQLAADPTDDESAALAMAWAGATVSGASFEVFPQNDPAVYARRVRDLLNALAVPKTGQNMVFDGSSTASGDPGAGKVRANSASNPTALYISETDADGGNIASLLASLDDVTNATARSILSFRPTDGASAAPTFGVTGAITDNGAWVTVPVTLINGDIPADRAALAMSAVPSGADGTFSGTEVVETSGWTFAAADRGKTFIANSGSALTAAFAAASSLGSTWMVVIKNIGAGTLTLDPNGSETIDGATTLALGTGESAVISCNGSALRTELRSFGNTAAAARANMAAIGGSTGATDNRLLRSDGTGGATLQNSAITVDDSGNMSGIAGITMSGGVTAGASAAFVTSVTTNLVSASASIVPTLIMQRGRGSGTPGAVQSGDGLGGCLWAPHDGTNYGSPNTAAFFAYAEENFTTSAHGSRIAFETTPTGSTTRGERLRIGQGVYHASATGGDKGNNTINFGAVYDDNTLLTCAALSEEFISQGTIDLDYWDGLVPDQIVPEKRDLVPQTYSLERQTQVARDVPDESGRLIRRVETVTEVEEVHAFIADPVFDTDGNIVDGAPTYLYDEVVVPEQTIKRQHRTARIFKAMLDAGFDPRDPEQYFARMTADQALPGMPTRGDGPLKWEHNTLSIGELASQKWLAMEMLAIVCNAMWLKLKDHEARIAALETGSGAGAGA